MVPTLKPQTTVSSQLPRFLNMLADINKCLDDSADAMADHLQSLHEVDALSPQYLVYIWMS